MKVEGFAVCLWNDGLTGLLDKFQDEFEANDFAKRFAADSGKRTMVIIYTGRSLYGALA